jgi:hypothetical protein
MSLVKHPRCPFCHEEVLASDPKRACEACMAWQHRGCWSEGGDRCATCGAAAVVPPPSAGTDLRGSLEAEAESISPLVRPECCRQRPCARHAVLSSLLLALDADALRQVAHHVDLELVADCPAPVAREVLRAVDVELVEVLRGLRREQLVAACERVGLEGGGTKRELADRLLARSLLVRSVRALPLSSLRRLAEALGVTLSDPRWIEGVQRDLLRVADLDVASTLRALDRDDLALLCRRCALPDGGAKPTLERRLRESSRFS